MRYTTTIKRFFVFWYSVSQNPKAFDKISCIDFNLKHQSYVKKRLFFFPSQKMSEFGMRYLQDQMRYAWGRKSFLLADTCILRFQANLYTLLAMTSLWEIKFGLNIDFCSFLHFFHLSLAWAIFKTRRDMPEVEKSFLLTNTRIIRTQEGLLRFNWVPSISKLLHTSHLHHTYITPTSHLHHTYITTKSLLIASNRLPIDYQSITNRLPIDCGNFCSFPAWKISKKSKKSQKKSKKVKFFQKTSHQHHTNITLTSH
jgi:hypothetical protein